MKAIVKNIPMGTAGNAVMMFSFLGIFIGILALNRTRAAREAITSSGVATQFMSIVRPAGTMGMLTLVLSILATIYGLLWLFMGA